MTPGKSGISVSQRPSASCSISICITMEQAYQSSATRSNRIRVSHVFQAHHAERSCSGRAGLARSTVNRDGIPPLPAARSLGHVFMSSLYICKLCRPRPVRNHPARNPCRESYRVSLPSQHPHVRSVHAKSDAVESKARSSDSPPSESRRAVKELPRLCSVMVGSWSWRAKWPNARGERPPPTVAVERTRRSRIAARHRTEKRALDRFRSAPGSKQHPASTTFLIAPARGCAAATFRSQRSVLLILVSFVTKK